MMHNTSWKQLTNVTKPLSSILILITFYYVLDVSSRVFFIDSVFTLRDLFKSVFICQIMLLYSFLYNVHIRNRHTLFKVLF